MLDAFSRRVVGWAMATHLRTQLVLDALEMALRQRRPRDVIHHSDQGSQYTSIAFASRCRLAGVRPSMGSVGACYDNALCESFFATVECEHIDRRRFPIQSAARMAVSEFIEGWYRGGPLPADWCLGLTRFRGHLISWEKGVHDALEMALRQRRPQGVIHHSDQGSQYTSIAFGSKCRRAGVRPSMGSVGDCYDNALCESFFATLECELIDRRRFPSQSQARMAVFEFIEGWHNSRRRHSSIGYLSPINYEKNQLPPARPNA